MLLVSFFHCFYIPHLLIIGIGGISAAIRFWSKIFRAAVNDRVNQALTAATQGFDDRAWSGLEGLDLGSRYDLGLDFILFF